MEIARRADGIRVAFDVRWAIIRPYAETALIQLKNILVATDFSDESQTALTYGRDLARTFYSTLHVLHVVGAAPAQFGTESYSAVMGSVAEPVVRTAPCPVLAVRHPEREFVVPIIDIRRNGDAIDRAEGDNGWKNEKMQT
jgi:hypothetical protein